MKVNKIVLALSALAVLASCLKTEDSGMVSFALSADQDLIEVTKSSVGDYTALPASSDFRIVVKNSSSAVLWDGLLSEYDPLTKYAVGNYTVEATYGTEGEEGFDKPYFAGSKSFAVTGGNTTTVSIPVKLANSLVKLECTEAFRNYFTDYSFRLSTGSNTLIDFHKEETRAAFIEAYRFSVSATMTSQSGTPTSFTKEYSGGIEAATCYTLRFDLANVGGVSVTITFNDSTQTVDLGEVELNE